MTLLFPKHKSHRRFCWRWLRSCIRYCSIMDNLAVVRRPDNTFDERAECRLQSTEQSKHCRQCGFRGSECLRRSRRCSQTPAICHRQCRRCLRKSGCWFAKFDRGFTARCAYCCSGVGISSFICFALSRFETCHATKCLLASRRLIQRRC